MAKHAKKTVMRVLASRTTASVALTAAGLLAVGGIATAGGDDGSDDKKGGSGDGGSQTTNVIVTQDENNEDNDENSFEDNVAPILNNVINDTNVVTPIQACGNDVNVLAVQDQGEEGGDETECTQDTNTDNEVDGGETKQGEPEEMGISTTSTDGDGDTQTTNVVVEQNENNEDNDENSFKDNVLPILNNVVNDVNVIVPVQACGNDVNVAAIQVQDGGDETECDQATNTDNRVDGNE